MFNPPPPSGGEWLGQKSLGREIFTTWCFNFANPCTDFYHHSFHSLSRGVSSASFLSVSYFLFAFLHSFCSFSLSSLSLLHPPIFVLHTFSHSALSLSFPVLTLFYTPPSLRSVYQRRGEENPPPPDPNNSMLIPHRQCFCFVFCIR